MLKSSIRFVIVLLGIMVISQCAGCADLQGALAQTSAWRDEASALRQEINARLGELEAQRETISDDAPGAPVIDAALATARAKITALDAAIGQADLVIEEALHPSDSLTRIAQGVSAWVPAPAQGPLVLGAALVATLVRSRQLKQGAASIIQSLEHVMGRDEQFRALFASHADTIRTIQTPAARRLVDKTLGKSA